MTKFIFPVQGGFQLKTRPRIMFHDQGPASSQQLTGVPRVIRSFAKTRECSFSVYTVHCPTARFQVS